MEPQMYIGGQAVIEGVMMRRGDKVAVAVRKPNRDIHVDMETRESLADKYPLLRWPILRGCAVLYESMVVGMQALTKSSHLAFDEGEEAMSPWQLAVTIFSSLVFGIGFFILLPVFIAKWVTTSGVGFALVEGGLRLAFFIGYIGAISFIKDIRRTFEYHGAEHKTINCFEAGEELIVENVRKHTLIHRRCGTSFLLFVFLFSIVLFSFFSGQTLPLLYKVLARILLLPVVAGLSYELIRLSASTTNPLLLALVTPGFWMQRMTTREPDDEQIEVAIASVKAILEEHTEDDRAGSSYTDESATG
ncbi:DUF1385 domain-containing protein [Collibacillus ludicampi]|uniref:DUF1385 domain-containing protein n=1 Tax=Collibacillus ludicampi TaxID=2771369 RepID=UPI0024949918|nr:DUF1385 domain-containing protein [Collibacillus ludicampi]